MSAGALDRMANTGERIAQVGNSEDIIILLAIYYDDKIAAES
jgi:hypothetical protein